MMLIGSGRSPKLNATSLTAGEDIALHFSVATPQGQLHFRTQAKIARLLDSGNGIGVTFEGGIPNEAYQALIQFSIASGTSAPPIEHTSNGGDSNGDGANGSATNGVDGYAGAGTDPQIDIPEALLRDKSIDEAAAADVRQRVERVMQRGLQRVCNQFFAATETDLLVKARDSGTNAMQMMYFEGLDLIEKHESKIRKTFTDSVLQQVNQVSDLDDVLERRRRRETGNTTKLEIVDTEQFEEWLAVAELISKTEARYTDILLDLRSQLGLVAKPWGHKDVVPVGPAVIAWAFDDAIKSLEFRRQVKRDIYHCFEHALIPVLGNVYEALLTLLDDSGVFPSIEELREKIQESTVRRTASGVRVEPEAYQEMDTALREATMAADGVGSAPRVDHNPFVPQTGGTALVYNTARNMLGLGRQANQMMGRPAPVMLAPNDAPDAETFNSEELLEAMAMIEAELGDAPLKDKRLKTRLVEVLHERHGESKAFRENDFDNLEVVENLVESVRADDFLTQGIREWVKRLELTLNKLAAKEPAFLYGDEANPHSAVQMLNQLARLGNAGDTHEGIDREVGHRVDELLNKVVGEYDDNPKVFEEVVSELNPLVDKQSRAYRGNIERTVRASEGQQKLARARRAVLDEVEQRIEGRDVPDLILELLNPGWRNLMVHTHLRKGVDSNEWRDEIATIDQLIGQLNGEITKESDSYVAPEALLKRVVEGLNGISFDPSKRTPLIMNLSSALVGDASGEKAPATMSKVDPGGAVEALGLEGLLPETDPSIDTADTDLRESWEQALERARRIQVGEWLATSDEQKRPLILTTAFLGDDYSSFVLVNRKGVRVKELNLKEMADGLHDGHITLLDDYDLPLMERASQRMLENMHNQLAYQSSHDDLTQLINRKEFERKVEISISVAKAKEVQHALLYIDLDQFKVINNTSGHTAGDELLKQIADTLTRLVQGKNASIARLGGDEFGVLLDTIETQESRDFAEEILGAIREQKFEWDGRYYSLSASMGLVFVDASTESVDAAMQHADEACYSAKDAGRNRVQEYEFGDSHMMQRHGVMEWVTQLDKALDDDRLVLNCQRIEAINRTGPSDDHYEILLTMKDELGDPMPPTEFIIAAETYNRMTLVDRWVIERVLSWMSERREQLDQLGGFSINVSGHSINDATFADFVLEQFSKTQAPTGKVCFEITETAAIANLENAVDFMNRMKIIGCQFSLDDFGTGLSSYSYLRNLPVDYVKIDGVFVRDIADNPGDYAVVRSINEIGHYMGKKTIAEFVTDDKVFKKIREIGVDYAQGYEIDRPIPLADLKI